jgi:hypothetical protein
MPKKTQSIVIGFCPRSSFVGSRSHQVFKPKVEPLLYDQKPYRVCSRAVVPKDKLARNMFSFCKLQRRKITWKLFKKKISTGC